MVTTSLNSREIDMNDPTVRKMFRIREDHARVQREDYSHVFRPKSRIDFVRLSCIIVAIELAYAAETAFVTPILLQIGVEHKLMTMVWGLSPLLGFFISPILGSISDRCRCCLGRRRPLIIGLSAGIVLGLILIPYGKTIGNLLGDMEDLAKNPKTNATLFFAGVPRTIQPNISNHWVAFIFTIMGTILLDFNADTCQTPSRAYVLDVCIPSDHAKALSTFSIMAGFGGTFGYAIGAVDWTSTSIGIFFGGNYQTVFAIVLIVFVICFSITITSFREIPLDLIEKDELLRPLTTAMIEKELKRKHNNIVYFIKEATAKELELTAKVLKKGEKLNFVPDNYNFRNSRNMNNNMINSLQNKNDSKTVLLEVSLDDDDEMEKVSLRTYLKSIIFMPKSIRILALTNLLCHMAHLSYCLYFTDFVGETVFGGDPSAPFGSPLERLYDEGVRYGCWGLTIYAFSCSIYSMLIETFMAWTSTKTVYVGGILAFAAGMLTLAIWPTKAGVIIFSMLAGIIYATLFTMPFILIAEYHSKGLFKLTSEEKSSTRKQSRGLGTDIAIISSMVFVGQLIVSLSMGSLITLIGSTSAVLYVASGIGVLAAISASSVLYVD